MGHFLITVLDGLVKSVRHGLWGALSGVHSISIGPGGPSMGYGLWIGLGGSLSILVKIFISVIWLKLYIIVKVLHENTFPVHMADFMVFLNEKKRPKLTLSWKSENFNKNQ